MTLLARHRSLLLLLGAALAWRIALAFVVVPGKGHASDLGLFWEWARALAANGPGAFYASTGSANYPPLYLYVLWGLGLTGEPALLKLPAILADIGIGAILYALASRWRGSRAGLVAAALFLFLPVSWYDSALWGQVDAVGTLVVCLALLLLVDGWSEAALVTAVLAVLVKPQYAIGLGVVLPVLVGRHLLRPGSGPVPVLGRVAGRANAALGGLLLDQSPRRLASSVVAAGVIGVLVLLPFDLARYAPASLADVPVIAQVAGLAGLFGRLGSEFTVLTANAFNPWALAGSPSLAQSLSGGGWIDDALIVVADVPAVAIGAGGLVVVGLFVGGGLLVRDGIVPILLGFSILALAFFVLPTRVHERYLFPFFATASVLAAPSIARMAGLATLNVLAAVNLHAVLAGGLFMRAGSGAGGRPGGFGGGSWGFGRAGYSALDLPFADLARSEPAVTVVALALAGALVALLAAWVVVVRHPPRAAGDAAVAGPVPTPTTG
jgi:hypothetical protein